MDRDQAIARLTARIAEWESKPKTDGYTYEKSFSDVMEGLQRDLFELSLGSLPQDRNAKKKSRPDMAT